MSIHPVYRLIRMYSDQLWSVMKPPLLQNTAEQTSLLDYEETGLEDFLRHTYIHTRTRTRTRRYRYTYMYIHSSQNFISSMYIRKGTCHSVHTLRKVRAAMHNHESAT